MLALLCIIAGNSLPATWTVWIGYLTSLVLEFDFSFGAFFHIPYKPVYHVLFHTVLSDDCIQYFLFFGFMIMPALTLLLFKKSLKQDRWEKDYVDRWGRSYVIRIILFCLIIGRVTIAVFLWIAAIIGSAIAAFFLDYRNNIARYIYIYIYI